MPRILICTVDCFNSKIGSTSYGTFSAILNHYDSSQLFNLYIREEIPDSDMCSRYFQISERQVIKSLFNRKIKTGREVEANREISPEDLENINKTKELYNKNRKKRSYFKLFIRELIWLFGGWKSKELNDYIDSIKPDIVIFIMEGYIHFNRICRYVVKRSGAKAIGYFCDDTFTYKQLPKIHNSKYLRFFQRRSLKKTAKYVDAFWAISEKTKKEADLFFGVNSEIVTKPTIITKNVEISSFTGSPIKMMYAGNLLVGRFNTIKLLSKAIEKINKDEEKIILDIYTPTFISPEDLNCICDSITIHPPVTPQRVLEIQYEADILLFAEDIVGKYKCFARLSFSTKITDYLSSGKCIFAIGDKDTAPMYYFNKERCAVCATSVEEIYDKLLFILNNPDTVKEYTQRALQCAKTNHSKEHIKEIVSKTIERLSEEE